LSPEPEPEPEPEPNPDPNPDPDNNPKPYPNPAPPPHQAHLSIPASSEVWVFFDFLSIPQKDRSLQLKAIASLPYYASLCSRFIPLVRDPDDWVSLHGGADAPPVSGTLSRYLERGWCRLEAVAALCPKRFDGSGAWRPGPLNLRFRLHQSPEDAGVGRLIVAADLLDPREGDFHNEADRAAIEQVLRRIALEYLQYEESGATCWDTMIDVRTPALTLTPALALTLRLSLRLTWLTTTLTLTPYP